MPTDETRLSSSLANRLVRRLRSVRRGLPFLVLVVTCLVLAWWLRSSRFDGQILLKTVHHTGPVHVEVLSLESERSPWASLPMNDEDAFYVLDLADHHDLLFITRRFGRTTVHRVSGLTGRAAWSADVSSLGWCGDESVVFMVHQLFGEQSPRLLQPAPDLNRDGVVDVVWLGESGDKTLAMDGTMGTRLEPIAVDSSFESSVEVKEVTPDHWRSPLLEPGSGIGGCVVLAEPATQLQPAHIELRAAATGSLRWRQILAFRHPFRVTQCLLAPDFNGDQVRDLIVISEGRGSGRNSAKALFVDVFSSRDGTKLGHWFQTIAHDVVDGSVSLQLADWWGFDSNGAPRLVLVYLNPIESPAGYTISWVSLNTASEVGRLPGVRQAALADLDGDGLKELCYSQGGRFRALSGSPPEVWRIALPSKESSAASSLSHQPFPLFNIPHIDDASPTNVTSEFVVEFWRDKERSRPRDLPQHTLADLDADGISDVLVANWAPNASRFPTSNSFASGSSLPLWVHSGKSGRLRWQARLPSAPSLVGPRRIMPSGLRVCNIVPANLDGDQGLDVACLIGTNYDDDRIAAWSGSGRPLWQSLLPGYTEKLSVAGDWTGDGVDDLFLVSRRETRLLSGKTGATVWTHPVIEESEFYDPVDLDGDGRVEIPRVERSSIAVIDPATWSVVWSYPAPHVRDSWGHVHLTQLYLGRRHAVARFPADGRVVSLNGRGELTHDFGCADGAAVTKSTDSATVDERVVLKHEETLEARDFYGALLWARPLPPDLKNLPRAFRNAAIEGFDTGEFQLSVDRDKLTFSAATGSLLSRCRGRLRISEDTVAGEESDYMVAYRTLPADDRGRYSFPDRAAISPPLTPDPRFEVMLPWVPTRTTVLMLTLAAKIGLSLVILGAWCLVGLVRGVRRRRLAWPLRHWLLLPTLAGVAIVAWPHFTAEYGALGLGVPGPVTLALLGVSMWCFPLVLGAALLRRRWRTALLLAIGSVAAATTIGTVMLAFHRARLHSLQSYSWYGWSNVWFLGAHAVGPLGIVLGRGRRTSSKTTDPHPSAGDDPQ